MFSCTYTDYKADSATLAGARKAYAQKEYKTALEAYRQARCFPDLSVLDKINIAVCYAALKADAKVAATLKSIDVRYFLRGADPVETYDAFLSRLPPKYEALKAGERTRLREAATKLGENASFHYLRHLHGVDQAIRGNVYHDSLQHYADFLLKAKYNWMRSQSQLFYDYVRQNGWPGYSTGGNYPEILATHDLDHLQEHLDSSIVAAEKGEGDWMAVENLSGKIQSIKRLSRLPPPTLIDTIKQNFFDDQCQFAPNTRGLLKTAFWRM